MLDFEFLFMLAFKISASRALIYSHADCYSFYLKYTFKIFASLGLVS